MTGMLQNPITKLVAPEAEQQQPIFVNPKQYNRIMARRKARARLEAQRKIALARKVGATIVTMGFWLPLSIVTIYWYLLCRPQKAMQWLLWRMWPGHGHCYPQGFGSPCHKKKLISVQISLYCSLSFTSQGMSMHVVALEDLVGVF